MNENTKHQGMAIASLVLGIFSMICFGIITGIPAIILGHVAFNRTRKKPEQYQGKGLAITGFVMGYISIFTTLILAGLLLPALAQAKGKAQSIMCVNNMKQMGLAFRVYASNHGDRFPFNVPTSEGGIMDASAAGDDGFVQDPARFFQSLSNELATPQILVCPADRSKRPTKDFQNLQAANVSYQLRTGTNISEANPQEVLARCPIHGNEVLCDGSVQQGRRRR